MSAHLEDFIPVYDDIDAPNLKKIISKKKEFLDYASDAKEELPPSGGYFKSQQLFINIMKAYDRILNISETGTGKSCQIIGLAQYYKHNRDVYRGAYVLQKASTVEEFKRAILCDCAGVEYQTDLVKNAKTPASRKSNATREIGKWYQVMTYHEFSLSVIGLTDKQIIEKFSGYLFFVDEAHNLRNDGMTSARDLSIIYQNIKKVFHLAQRTKIIISTATPMINSPDELPKMANLILPSDQQLPEDWDYNYVSFEQLRPFLDNKIFYIRGLDTGAIQVYQNNPQVPIKETTIHKFEVLPEDWKGQPIRDDEKQIIPSDELETKEIKTQLILYPTIMGEIQNEKYLQITRSGVDTKAIERVADDDLFDSPYITEDDEIKGGKFHIEARQASCFVYPPKEGVNEEPTLGGSFEKGKGKKDVGLNLWVSSPNPGQYIMDANFKEFLSEWDEKEQSYSNMAACSSKYAAIMKVEKQAEENKEPGCTFCYVDYVNGSGAIILGMCFEACGYKPFNRTESVFIESKSSSEHSRNSNVCGKESEYTERKINPNFPKEKRYVLLTSKTIGYFDVIKEIFNSKENINGEYIKAIICTPAARDGINIFNITRAHLITPGWHESGVHQAMSRYIRAVSHVNLVQYLGHEVEVKVYYHAAIPYNLISGKPLPEKSIDRIFYLHAEYKNIKVRRLMRILKRFDICAHLNTRRNIRPTDVDYSKVCDYDECQYVNPIEVKEDDIDYTTYDILYANEVIPECMEDIGKILQEYGFIRIDTLITFFTSDEMSLTISQQLNSLNYREKFIYAAIERLISEKKVIPNRYGFASYLHRKGNILYLKDEYPLSSSFLRSEADEDEEKKYMSLLNEYTFDNRLIAIDHVPTEKIIVQENIHLEAPILDDIIATMNEIVQDEQSEESEAKMLDELARLDTLSNESKSKLLEEALIKYLTLDEKDYEGYISPIINRFSKSIYHSYEPFDDIIKAKELLRKGTKLVASRKITAKGKTRPNFGFIGERKEAEVNPETEEKTPLVYFHTLYSTSEELTNYATTSNYRNATGRIRIYRVGVDSEFRDANDFEYLAYVNIIHAKIDETFSKYDKYKYYGVYDRKGRFLICVNNPDVKGKVNQDSRYIERGKYCGSWAKHELLQILKEYDIMPPEVDSLLDDDKYDRKEAEAALTEKNRFYTSKLVASMKDEDIKFLIKWYCFKPATVSYLCSVIRLHFEENDMLYVE